MFSAMVAPFEVRTFAIEQRGAHLKLRAVLFNKRHLVVGAQVVSPGTRFAVETPARLSLLFAGLILAGSAWVIPASVRAVGVGALVAGAASAGLAFVSMPIILAGQQLGWDIDAFSLDGVIVAASSFLLHGGGLAICGAAIWFNLVLSARVAAAGERSEADAGTQEQN
ncbi:MAG: hypothetical protein H7Z19_07185 [Chitinophagaceae bacterium]|nr:hypothetical protein [Rubrivivax sp.]